MQEHLDHVWNLRQHWWSADEQSPAFTSHFTLTDLAAANSEFRVFTKHKHKVSKVSLVTVLAPVLYCQHVRPATHDAYFTEDVKENTGSRAAKHYEDSLL